MISFRALERNKFSNRLIGTLERRFQLVSEYFGRARGRAKGMRRNRRRLFGRNAREMCCETGSGFRATRNFVAINRVAAERCEIHNPNRNVLCHRNTLDRRDEFNKATHRHCQSLSNGCDFRNTLSTGRPLFVVCAVSRSLSRHRMIVLVFGAIREP